jgi:hypothetical protein
MPIDFEELADRDTPSGELSLRRCIEPSLGTEVHEVKLGNAFLMSSLFTRSEIALAGLALAGLDVGSPDVVVGGLGLATPPAPCCGTRRCACRWRSRRWPTSSTGIATPRRRSARR